MTLLPSYDTRVPCKCSMLPCAGAPPIRPQVRFCTEPYAPPAAGNLDHVYAHLTNYAVNKHNGAFQFNQ